MKRIITTVIAAMMICVMGSCSSNTKDAELPASNRVDVVMGYSIDQFNLCLDDASGLSAQQMKYNDQVNVNGHYTDVYQTSGNKSTLMVLQGYYKTDLEQGEVFLNGRTFSKDDLSEYLVYEDTDIAVYDVSYYLFPNSLDSRIQDCGVTNLNALDSLQNIEEQIEVKKAPAKSQKPQKVQQATGTINL